MKDRTGIVAPGAVALTLALACAGTAGAGWSWSIAPAPGGFVQAGSGPSTPGAWNWPGSDYTGQWSGAGADFEEGSYSGNTSATADASSGDGSYSNSGNVTAGLGWLNAFAANNAPNSSNFAAGASNGGWSELFTVSHPSHTGQQGYLVFTLDVNGTLFASGFAGSASFSLTGYVDGGQLMINPYFDAGGSDLLSTDRQFGHWAVATYGNPPTESKTVSDTVTFAVPFTFGTQFKLGIYAHALAGMRSSSSVLGNSTAESDFSGEGLRWGGISAVLLQNGTPVNGAVIVSGSGLDWGGPVTPPSPADFNGDGHVNGDDLGTLLGQWGPCPGCSADFNGDGKVDGDDLGFLLGEWTG